MSAIESAGTAVVGAEEIGHMAAWLRQRLV
jgi:hypothetical protein